MAAPKMQPRVAVIGCGVSGLGAAYGLRKHARLTLYESANYLGGHANTVMVDGAPIDTGFLVYNENTYPNLIGLFEELNVPSEPSDMSFSVSLAGRSFEWGSDGLSGLFATRSNLLSPSFHAMIADMTRFNKEAPAWLKEVTSAPSHPQAGWTMREYLAHFSYGQPFTHWYLLPQVAAVWSASSSDVLAFPAVTFIRFCVNHSLLQAVDRPQWRTVSRRSREYVRRVTGALDPSTTTIRLSTPVTSVVRKPTSDPSSPTGAVVTVTDAKGGVAEFDAVVFGCHPDTALGILGADASPAEREVLGSFIYQNNVSYLHSDVSLMPQRKAAWASWNYVGKGEGTTIDASDAEPCCVTYWLNRLQNLPPSSRPLFVTLNPSPSKRPDPSLTHATFNYAHPQYTVATVAAQGRLVPLQGRLGAWYAGAYLGYGFHEDGITAGLRAAYGITNSAAAPSWWDQPYYNVPKLVADQHNLTSAAASDPLSPASLLADVRAKKASGGPYWRDNLGNGGPVGQATMEVVAATAKLRASVKSSTPADVSGLISTGGEGGDITGYTCSGPSDVMHAHRHLVGLAGVDSATASSASSSSSSSTTGRLSPSNSSDANSTVSGGGDGAASDSDHDGSDISVAGASTAGTPLQTPSAAAAKQKQKGQQQKGLRSLGGAKKGPSLAIDTSRSNNSSDSSASAVQSLLLGGRRAYKSQAVGSTLLSSLKAAAAGGKAVDLVGPYTASGATCTTPLGPRMKAGQGGYTAQETPLQTPNAYRTLLTWAWDQAKTAGQYAAASPVLSFLRKSVVQGCILVKMPDGSELFVGDPSAAYPYRARIRVHSWNFFLRVAAETDLGLARSFIAGEWTCDDLTSLFHIFILNRDQARTFHAYGLWTAWIGASVNYLSFVWNMDNSLAGSRRNISAHYDISNDLYTSFLDPRTMMYSCGFFDVSRRYVKTVDLPAVGTIAGSADSSSRLPLAAAVASSVTSYDVPSSSPSAAVLEAKASGAPAPTGSASTSDVQLEVVFGGSLSDAQTRKLDHLIARANVQPTDRVLDLGFGWGGLSIRLAETIGCRVHGITLSKEQLALATERVQARGLSHLITFELVDYREFAKAHKGEFDKIISIEMVEAVGHNYFPDYLFALDTLLAPNGVVVLQAITMPEARYQEYIRSTDFINTIIFPGGCCPSLAALTAAMMAKTELMLHSVDNFAVHYAETLRRWRANFNAALGDVVRPLGFDDAFIRTWNYYLCYCEAGFASQTLGLQVLTFTRPNNTSLLTGTPAGRLADPIGPITNDPEHPILIPAGAR